MKDFQSRKASDIRKQHNIELIRRMRNGESLTSFDSRASWYPPRPIIKKDSSEIARLYDAAESVAKDDEQSESVSAVVAQRAIRAVKGSTDDKSTNKAG